MRTLSTTDREALATTVRVSQIIVAAMLMGGLVFLVIALAIGPVPGGLDRNAHPPLLTFMALGFVLVALVVRVVVRGTMVRQGRQAIVRGAADLGNEILSLARLFQTRLIVSLALIEGPTFFLLVAYMLERSPLAVGVAVLLMAAMALHWPTTTSIAHWVEEQLAILEQERQFVGR